MLAPVAYAVFDCETTGTAPDRDEIVSLAVLRLDADGAESGRLARLVRPSCPIPARATAIHSGVRKTLGGWRDAASADQAGPSSAGSR